MTETQSEQQWYDKGDGIARRVGNGYEECLTARQVNNLQAALTAAERGDYCLEPGCKHPTSPNDHSVHGLSEVESHGFHSGNFWRELARSIQAHLTAANERAEAAEREHQRSLDAGKRMFVELEAVKAELALLRPRAALVDNSCYHGGCWACDVKEGTRLINKDDYDALPTAPVQVDVMKAGPIPAHDTIRLLRQALVNMGRELVTAQLEAQQLYDELRKRADEPAAGSQP